MMTTNAAPSAIAIHKALDQVIRCDRGRLLAGLVTRLGDIQLAEDALQDAMISALSHWSKNGLPSSPVAWLMKAGFNKGIDRIRKDGRENQKAVDTLPFSNPDIAEDQSIPDDRLRLIFACCHPAIAEKSRISLTLRTVCNLTTREIAKVFLDTEPAMGQRLSRTKTQIKAKGISFEIPDRDQWPTRLNAVLSTIYLIFTIGYVADDQSARDLCAEALFLARLLNSLHPEDPEIEGLVALMLFSESRRRARVDDDGATIPIHQQDRMLWNAKHLSDAQDIMAVAVSRKQPGPFQIKAAISDCSMAYPGPDWQQMSFLYQSLWAHEPTPIVALNWAVVLAELGELEFALDKVQQLGSELSDFQPWHATRAELLARRGDVQAAKEAYIKAIEDAPNKANQLFLTKQLRALGVH